MDYEDVKKYFGRVQICNIHEGYEYSFEEFPNTNEAVCKAKVGKRGLYTFSISQKDARMMSEADEDNYNYSETKLLLMKVNSDGSKEYIKGINKCWQRDTYLECQDLEAGEYLLVAEVDWFEETDEKSFVITCYGESHVDLEDMDDEEGFEPAHVTRQAAEAIVAQKLFDCDTTPNNEDSNILKSKVKSDHGYMMIVIQNNGSQSYNETVQYSTFDGLTLIAPEEGKEYDITVGPGETRVVLIRICRRSGWSMSSSTQTVVG